MRTSRYFIVIFILTFHACQEHSIFSRQNKITKLTFATGGCFGNCSFMAIEIDSNLDYKFYGGKYCEIGGYYKGKISQAFWDIVNIRFEPLQDRSLDTNIRSVDDLSIQSIIHFGQSVKNIEKQEIELPKDVRDNFYWLMDSYKKVNLIKMTDSIHFETSIQNVLPILSPPNNN